MDWIDESFAFFAGFLSEMLPDGVLTNLLTEGIIPGLSGIAMFVPQIFILFLIISMFEEVGYMSRAVYLFDGIMQRFGMNGRSIVTLISGGACAVPAIMSTRIISNWKERLITIMVTPLISCSARIPVFAILVAFLIPSFKVFYVFNSQGLVFMGLYLLGIISALFSAFVFKKILKSEETSYLMIEMPDYKMPDWKNVFFNVWNKVKSFVLVAGKVIFFISIVLWFLASYGGNFNDEKVKKYQTEAQQMDYDEEAIEVFVNSKKLEYSYAGQMGKFIEPVIEPLGFDWKIGIALITSFAAREVFVGTMSTLYSIGNDNPQTIREKLKNEVNPKTGKPMFTFAVALSLLLFYVFALQCMSTLAVVYKETRSWKWPIIQFVYMGAMAYFASLIAYQLFK
jgi:ferrous iron transport protein B